MDTVQSTLCQVEWAVHEMGFQGFNFTYTYVISFGRGGEGGMVHFCRHVALRPNRCLWDFFFLLLSESKKLDLICTGYIGAVLVYMLLHLRVFKACTLCVGLNIAVPEQDLTALKGAAWLASHIICQAYKGTFLLQYLYRYVLLLIIRGVMLKREEKKCLQVYIYMLHTHILG